MNKTAIITGASTGIGREIAIALAKEDYHIALVARTKNLLEETKKLIENEKDSAEVFIADLSGIDSINALISDIKSKFKSIDVLVNVAGIWHGDDEVFAGKDFDTFSQKVILNTYHVGTIAPTLLAHAFIPLMSNGSRIINISGTFESGAKGWLPYFVSKRAIEDLTIGLAEELKDKGSQSMLFPLLMLPQKPTKSISLNISQMLLSQKKLLSLQYIYVHPRQAIFRVKCLC